MPHFLTGEYITRIVDDCAKKLGCTPYEVFLKAAVANGFIDCHEMAKIWQARYTNERCLAEDVVNFALEVMTGRPSV